MASSSRTKQTLQNCNNTEEHNLLLEGKISKHGQEEEEEEEWLKLGLGLGSETSCKKREGHVQNPVLDSPSLLLLTPSSQALSSPQIGLGLGFEQGSGLEPKGNNEGLGVVVMEPSDYHNSLLGWSLDHCNNYHYYHHDDDDNGMVLLPSCQIESQNLPMPVPSDSHHYYARSLHNSGLWFTLHSSTNQNGEALPQIPKAYIRVKDENMTVFMVKKYLVRKLGLSNEAEIDISCMGESLWHIQTLKQVRDSIWLPRLAESVNSTTLSLGDSHDMSINHLMSLIYRKRCIMN